MFKRIIVSTVVSATIMIGAVSASASTPGQRNALAKAKEYLQFESFSHKGLVAQLKFEGFTTAQATYGVNGSHVNWNVEAMKKAKEYLSNQAFSRSGLLAQLQFEGFTTAQATYGVKRAYR